ncbi:MAG: cysteine--tRNA ligase, partial [Dehalococcoidales bacterium]|nr:cysteine--tRNA ligase [Dehalococcoidales bacterium]
MKIYNTMSMQKEEFVPSGEYVTMYVCGITPQSEAHIGHAMSYINFDIIKRYLLFKGYKVKHIQNITDIEDKIINKANAMGITPEELVKKNTDSFWQDLESLNILKATEYPFATHEIPAIIDMIKGLVEKGYAYQTPNGVYYRVTKKDDYGKLAHRTLDQMLAGKRIEVDDEKENPMDFVLWKATKPGEPSWESPWGPGRPGWHIECSAMSLKYLGETIDIHGGGEDLIFPHHENEIAQSEAFTGVKPFVRFWLHNGLMQLGNDKMSKSIGNVISIKETLKQYTSDALRVFVLSSHYRSPLTYTAESMEAAQKGAERLAQTATVQSAGTKASEIDLDAYRTRFTEAMDDDFNSSQALAALYDLAREINKARDNGCDITKEVACFK